MNQRSIVKVLEARQKGICISGSNAVCVDRVMRNIEIPEVLFEGGNVERFDVFRLSPGDLSCLAFTSGRNCRVYIAMLENERLCHWPSAYLPQVTDRVKHWFTDIMWGSDRRMLITTDSNSMCKIWDLENFIELDAYCVKSKQSVIDYCSNGSIAATDVKGAYIIDPRSGFGDSLVGRRRNLKSVKWSIPSEKILYATDIDGYLLAYDIRMLKRTLAKKKVNHALDHLHSTPDGSHLVSNSSNKASIFDAYTLELKHTINFGHSESSVSGIFSGRSSLCSSGSTSILAVPVQNNIYRIDFSRTISLGCRPLVHSVLHGHASIIRSIDFDPHNHILYSGGNELVRWMPRIAFDMEEEKKKKVEDEVEEWSDDD